MSIANELAERNPVGGTDKAEPNAGRGQASHRQSQRCPVKVGGKGNNDDDATVYRVSSDVLI